MMYLVDVESLENDDIMQPIVVDDVMRYIALLQWLFVLTVIILFISNPAPSVSAVSDLKINLTASSINNTARKNDMRKWMKYLLRWK
jgi:hypothetical protein